MKFLHLKRYYFLLIMTTLSLGGCSSPEAKLSPLPSDAVILAFGDSLTFGTGRGVNSRKESYPAVLAELTGLKVLNEGVPGEVSQQGLQRMTEELDVYEPDLVILCHGGNDIIRQLSKEQLKSNLSQMIDLIKDSGAEVLLVAVPNFNLLLKPPALYQELATEHDIVMASNILSNILADHSLKSDQVHPNAAGYKLMAERFYQIMQQAGALP